MFKTEVEEFLNGVEVTEIHDEKTFEVYFSKKKTLVVPKEEIEIPVEWKLI